METSEILVLFYKKNLSFSVKILEISLLSFLTFFYIRKYLEILIYRFDKQRKWNLCFFQLKTYHIGFTRNLF